jgi:hypothetical protein
MNWISSLLGLWNVLGARSCEELSVKLVVNKNARLVECRNSKLGVENRNQVQLMTIEQNLGRFLCLLAESVFYSSFIVKNLAILRFSGVKYVTKTRVTF